MRRRLRPLLVPALCTLVAGAILVGLGVWQLHRLAWKDALIATIETRSRAAPHPLPPPTRWGAMKPADYEYDHVALTGTFDNADEILILRASPDGPGYHVITPFHLASGGTVLVDRGFVPTAMKARALRRDGEVAGQVRITGLLRAPESRNLFTPADDATRGTFYTRDPARIAAYLKLPDAAPFSVDIDPSPANAGRLPKAEIAGIAIPNNHFSYALTWFGLALGLLCVFVSYAWSRLVPPRPAAPEHSTARSR